MTINNTIIDVFIRYEEQNNMFKNANYNIKLEYFYYEKQIIIFLVKNKKWILLLNYLKYQKKYNKYANIADAFMIMFQESKFFVEYCEALQQSNIQLNYLK